MLAVALVGHVGNRATAASIAAIERGEPDRALAHAQRAIDWAPWSDEPWQLRGEAELLLEDDAAARKSLARALELNPESWSTWLDLAVASRGAERDARSSEAKRLNPLSPEVAELEAESKQNLNDLQRMTRASRRINRCTRTTNARTSEGAQLNKLIEDSAHRRRRSARRRAWWRRLPRSGESARRRTAVSAGQYQYGKKVTICHKGKNTITVGKAAVPAHLRHGDAIGSCASRRRRPRPRRCRQRRPRPPPRRRRPLRRRQAPAEGEKPGNGKGRGK